MPEGFLVFPDTRTRKNNLINEFRNSLHGTDGKDLKKTAFAESFVAYTNSGKDANQLDKEIKNSVYEPEELKKNKIAESFVEYVDSSKDNLNLLAKEFRNFAHEPEKLEKTAVAESFVEYSDSSKGHLNQLAEKFQNSVHGTDRDLKKTELARSFVEYADSSKDQRLLKTDLEIHSRNESNKENKLNQLFGSNLELMETHLSNSDESSLEKETEKFVTPLQRTGKEDADKTSTSTNSFVEYANISDKQRTIKTEKKNKHQLEIEEHNLNDTSVETFSTSVEHKLTDITENVLNKSNVNFQVTEGDEAIKTEIFTESSVQNASSNEAKEPLEAEFQKQSINEPVTVENNLSETTGAVLDISESGLSEVFDIKSDLLENDATDDLSVIELVANAINASDVFEFLNLTDSLHFEVVTENASSGIFEMDETALMSEGSEIALFQDDLTTGFEFLIDSETTKNLILTELLRSENFVVTENGKIAFLEESADSFPDIIELSELGAEENNEIEAIATKTNDVTIPIEKANLTAVPTEIKLENRNTLMDILVNSTDNSTVSKKSTLNSSLRNSTKFEVELQKIGDGTNLLEDPVSSTPEFAEKTCPEPGFCLIWFFAQDKCSDSTECHESSICCKIGCSKTCIDI